MTKIQAPIRGSAAQNLWLDGLDEMGGQFWPPTMEESEMPQVGARFPLMVYRGEENTTVYDEEELKQAIKNGFAEKVVKEAKKEEDDAPLLNAAAPKQAAPPAPPDKGKK